ncbi:MAG: hypothetical protein JW395_0633 [Nitrospira sp.]|nr:hypothetical protein [Nitrospira sp.]
MGKHIDELLRLGTLAARGGVDWVEVKAYHKANQEAILQEQEQKLKEIALANPAPPEESFIDWAKRMNAAARKKLEG